MSEERTSPRLREVVLEHRVLWGLVALGLVLRVVLILVSVGSNDMETWTKIAAYVEQIGVIELYEQAERFNHPPMMGLLAHELWELGLATGTNFRLLFKLPMLLADVLALRLLWCCWKPQGVRTAVLVLAVFSLNPISILITAFHGNTDTLCAVLVLWAAFEYDRGRWLLAGIALGAAINVKIAGLFAAPALFFLCKRPAHAAKLVLGCCLACLPFLWPLFEAPRAFVSNVFGYNSRVDMWGINVLALKIPVMSDLILEGYRAVGRYAIVGSLVALALWGRKRRFSSFRSVACAYAAFLFLTPGFGIQYLVWWVPILAAVSIKHSLRWAVCGGAVVVAMYASYLLDEWPLRTHHEGLAPDPTAWFSLAAWAVLALFLWEQRSVVADGAVSRN